jgi:hypothetical protein
MKQDGNVIHHDFGRRDMLSLTLSCSFDVLFADDHVCLGRLTYRIGERTFIQHVCVDGSA